VCPARAAAAQPYIGMATSGPHQKALSAGPAKPLGTVSTGLPPPPNRPPLPNRLPPLVSSPKGTEALSEPCQEECSDSLYR
jgi:hypothetical protein